MLADCTCMASEASNIPRRSFQQILEMDKYCIYYALVTCTLSGANGAALSSGGMKSWCQVFHHDNSSYKMPMKIGIFSVTASLLSIRQIEVKTQTQNILKNHFKLESIFIKITSIFFYTSPR